MGIEPEQREASVPESPRRCQPTRPNFAAKRKRREVEVEVPPLLPAALRVSGAGGNNWWESLTAAPTSAEGEKSSKKFRSLDREELRAMQVQRAMISDEDGDRQIHVAVAREDLKIVRRLCPLMKQAGIALDITNFLRQTALHLAVMVGHAEILVVLLDHGASPLLRDRSGNSVLHLAVRNFRPEVFRTLLEHPAVRGILDAADFEGYTALHHATLRGNSSAINYLHSFGADMNAVDGKSGRTSLVHAVLAENLDTVRLLVACGACPEKPDYSGQSAMDFALQSADAALVRTLERKSSSASFGLSTKMAAAATTQSRKPGTGRQDGGRATTTNGKAASDNVESRSRARRNANGGGSLRTKAICVM